VTPFHFVISLIILAAGYLFLRNRFSKFSVTNLPRQSSGDESWGKIRDSNDKSASHLHPQHFLLLTICLMFYGNLIGMFVGLPIFGSIFLLWRM